MPPGPNSQECLARFAQAWTGPSPPRVEDFLPPAPDPRRAALAAELAHADLGHRLTAGEPGRVENYLQAVPELAAAPDLVLGLIRHEFELRRGQEPGPSLQEYRERFPHLARTLEESLSTLPTRAEVTLSTAVPAGSPDPRSLPAEPDAPRPGTVLGVYEIDAELGRGGMGVVYRARHRLLNKRVALKVLSPRMKQSPEAVARFRREVEAAGRLEHPNLVRATDAGEAGVSFLVMELLDGTDLHQLSGRRGPWPAAEAAEAARQAALGLAHAHDHGLVHRDVKPSNLFLTRGGVVKLLDLGLARLREPDSDDPLTSPGQMMGTADYTAPEQMLDSRTADSRADLYSLGCTLFHLLAGEPPFGNSTHSTLARKREAHLRELPTPLRRRRPDVPAALAALVDGLLAKRPEDRPGPADAVAASLAPLASGADLWRFSEGSPPAALPTLPQPGRRRWLWTAGGLLAGAGLLGGLVWLRSGRDGVRLLSLTVRYARPDRDGRFRLAGLVGLPDARVPRGYAVRVVARLDRPGHAYVISLPPRGPAELWHPGAVDDPPEASVQLDAPARPVELPGLYAAVVVVSAEPLPVYAEWARRHGPLPWRESRSEVAWQFQDGTLRPLGGERAGTVEVDEPAVEELAAFLRDRSEAAAFVAFPVVDHP